MDPEYDGLLPIDAWDEYLHYSEAHSKTNEEIFDEYNDLNSSVDITTTFIRSKCITILEKLRKDSELIKIGKAFIDWSKDDILRFCSFVNKPTKIPIDQDKLKEELVCTAIRANKLFSSNDLRCTQIISLVSFIYESKYSGALLQIATGDGKSTITACLSAILSLLGNSVDVVTSSSVLAKRDAEDKSGLFSIFGLSVANNCDKDQAEPRPCYKANIVYGDSSSYQYDIINEEYSQKNKRGERRFDCVVVDEVDSMLIDESSKIAMIASQLPGADYLYNLYASIWAKLLNLKSQIATLSNGKSMFVEGGYTIDEKEEITPKHGGAIYSISNVAYFLYNALKNYTQNLVSSIFNTDSPLKPPRFLSYFISIQSKYWARSAITAYDMELGKDYIATKEANNVVISPVDYLNTGVINHSTKWSNGIHQFLELKHSVHMQGETLVTSFMSNIAFFLKYKKIYGMTGTLGSEDARELLSSIYKVNIGFIPTYKLKRFTELSGLVLEPEEYESAILKSIVIAQRQGKATLVICDSIKKVNQFSKALETRGIHPKIYTDSSATIESTINVREVIVATNLAGRGTDITTTSEVERAGGLLC